MKVTTKHGLLAVAIVCLALAGVASAHGFGSWRTVEEQCSDDMTVGDCRTAIQDAREARRLDACARQYDEGFCTDLLALQGEHRTELEDLQAEHGVEGRSMHAPPPHVQRDEAVCSDDMTVAQCRDAHEAAMRQARLDACAEADGEDYCTALFDLVDQQEAELQDLFDEHGYERPAFPGPGRHGPGGPGFGGPGQHGHGRPHGPF